MNSEVQKASKGTRILPRPFCDTDRSGKRASIETYSQVAHTRSRSFLVFKNADTGETWCWVTPLLDADSDDTEFLQVTSLIIDPRTPTTLYAGTWQRGVLRSTNGGENWYPINSGLPGMEMIP